MIIRDVKPSVDPIRSRSGRRKPLLPTVFVEPVSFRKHYHRELIEYGVEWPKFATYIAKETEVVEVKNQT